MKERWKRRKSVWKFTIPNRNWSTFALLFSKSEPEIKRYDEIYQSIAEIYKRHDFKKRVLVSPNKILSHEKLLEVF